MSTAVVLLHSPLVGPTTWRPVATELAARGVQVSVPSLLGVQSAPPPYWPTIVETAAAELEALAGQAIVVAHSGAGPLVPAISERASRRATAYLFVDASVPLLPGAASSANEAALRKQLAPLAEHGVLPPWSRWFGAGVMERLVPDAALRGEVEREMPRLPLAYFDERAPVSPEWPDAPCGYLQFSDTYADQAEETERRGWAIRRLLGGHLHMLVEPAAVATCLIEMADALEVVSGRG